MSPGGIGALLPSRRERLSAAVGAALVHLAVAGAAMATGRHGTYAWHDQVDYHRPTIEKFAADLPTPVLSDYQSATAPGFHLLMAVALRTGVDGVALHLVNAMFGALFVALFAWLVARFAGGLVGMLAASTLALSPYTINPSVFLATDNLASVLLLVAFAAALGIATGASTAPLRHGALAALAAMAAVAVRQIMAYGAGFPGAALVARSCAERKWPRGSALAGAALALIPAGLLLGILAWTWGGLVPPSFQTYHGSGGNPATPVYALALVSIWGGTAFLAIPGYWREFLSLRTLVIGVLAAAACCAVPSNFVVHVRFGGTLWTIASKFPEHAERSLLLVPLAGVGAAALGAYLRMWSQRGDSVARGVGAYALLAFTGMVFAQTANSQCFERYLQPLTLVFMSVAAAALAGRTMRGWPFALAAGVSALWTALSLLKGGS